MILVVANHVAGMGFGMAPKISSSMQFLIMFRMPLFFFVSGFLAYKAAQVWDLKNLGSLLLKKIRVQTIPTFVFFLFGAAILGVLAYCHRVDRQAPQGRLLVYHRTALYVYRLLSVLLHREQVEEVVDSHHAALHRVTGLV